MKKNRNIGSIVCLVAAGILGVLPVQGEEQRAKDSAAVVKEMRDTAKQLVAERQQQYREGLAGIDGLLGAQRKLREVELRLISDPGERRGLLVATVKAAKETEKLVRARVEQGLSSSTELLEARLARLAAELDLLEVGG